MKAIAYYFHVVLLMFYGLVHAIGPLHDPVSWYKITHAGMQVTQLEFHNKATRTSPPWPAFVLEVSLCNLCASMCNFVPCDQIVQRAYCLPHVKYDNISSKTWTELSPQGLLIFELIPLQIPSFSVQLWKKGKMFPCEQWYMYNQKFFKSNDQPRGSSILVITRNLFVWPGLFLYPWMGYYHRDRPPSSILPGGQSQHRI